MTIDPLTSQLFCLLLMIYHHPTYLLFAQFVPAFYFYTLLQVGAEQTLLGFTRKSAAREVHFRKLPCFSVLHNIHKYEIHHTDVSHQHSAPQLFMKLSP